MKQNEPPLKQYFSSSTVGLQYEHVLNHRGLTAKKKKFLFQTWLCESLLKAYYLAVLHEVPLTTLFLELRDQYRGQHSLQIFPTGWFTALELSLSVYWNALLILFTNHLLTVCPLMPFVVFFNGEIGSFTSPCDLWVTRHSGTSRATEDKDFQRIPFILDLNATHIHEANGTNETEDQMSFHLNAYLILHWPFYPTVWWWWHLCIELLGLHLVWKAFLVRYWSPTSKHKHWSHWITLSLGFLEEFFIHLSAAPPFVVE